MNERKITIAAYSELREFMHARSRLVEYRMFLNQIKDKLARGEIRDRGDFIEVSFTHKPSMIYWEFAVEKDSVDILKERLDGDLEEIGDLEKAMVNCSFRRGELSSLSSSQHSLHQ